MEDQLRYPFSTKWQIIYCVNYLFERQSFDFVFWFARSPLLIWSLGRIHAKNIGVTKVVHKISSEHDLHARVMARYETNQFKKSSGLRSICRLPRKGYFLPFRLVARGPTISTKFPSGSLSISKQTSCGRPSGRICGLLA